MPRLPLFGRLCHGYGEGHYSYETSLNISSWSGAVTATPEELLSTVWLQRIGDFKTVIHPSPSVRILELAGARLTSLLANVRCLETVDGAPVTAEAMTIRQFRRYQTKDSYVCHPQSREFGVWDCGRFIEPWNEGGIRWVVVKFRTVHPASLRFSPLPCQR